MIDLHSHILVNIDDGASSLEDAIQLIQDSLNSGVTNILVTPHIHIGTFDNDTTIIRNAFNLLTEELQRLQLDISLAYAAEVRIDPVIMMLAKNKKLPFMGKWLEKDLLLLEFPHGHIPPGSEKLIDWLKKNNIQTMIAHPERNRDVWKFMECLNPFINRGCLFQITAASLVGDFGEKAEQIAWKLIESNHATLVASDMHNLKRRPSKMAEAYKLVCERFDKKIADNLFISTPKLIFNTNPTKWRLV